VEGKTLGEVEKMGEKQLEYELAEKISQGKVEEVARLIRRIDEESRSDSKLWPIASAVWDVMSPRSEHKDLARKFSEVPEETRRELWNMLYPYVQRHDTDTGRYYGLQAMGHHALASGWTEEYLRVAKRLGQKCYLSGASEALGALLRSPEFVSLSPDKKAEVFRTIFSRAEPEDAHAGIILGYAVASAWEEALVVYTEQVLGKELKMSDLGGLEDAFKQTILLQDGTPEEENLRKEIWKKWIPRILTLSRKAKDAVNTLAILLGFGIAKGWSEAETLADKLASIGLWGPLFLGVSSPLGWVSNQHARFLQLPEEVRRRWWRKSLEYVKQCAEQTGDVYLPSARIISFAIASGWEQELVEAVAEFAGRGAWKAIGRGMAILFETPCLKKQLESLPADLQESILRRAFPFALQSLARTGFPKDSREPRGEYFIRFYNPSFVMDVVEWKRIADLIDSVHQADTLWRPELVDPLTTPQPELFREPTRWTPEEFVALVVAYTALGWADQEFCRAVGEAMAHPEYAQALVNATNKFPELVGIVQAITTASGVGSL